MLAFIMVKIKTQIMTKHIPLEENTVYLLLGSNLGDRKKNLDDAIEQITVQLGEVFSRSAVYETDAWGKTDQPGFLNQALGLKTTLSPEELLDKVLNIEKELGRVRKERWGARLIDIDIILYDDKVINIGNKLNIPHPEMQNRKFVMQPLAEIAAEVIHPVLNESIKDLLKKSKDTLLVKKFN